MGALLLLLPGVLAGQASRSATTQRVEVGAIVGEGGDYLPKQYWGIGVWSPTWRAHRLEVDAVASVLRGVSHHDRACARTEEAECDTEESEQAQEQAHRSEMPPSDGGGHSDVFQSRKRPERAMGLEPTTSSLGSWHSTN